MIKMETVSAAIKALLFARGLKQTNLIGVVSTSRQGVYAKMMNNRWTARDLIAIAKATGAEVLIRMQDGIELDLTDSKLYDEDRFE